MLLELFASLHAWGSRMNSSRIKLIIAVFTVVGIILVGVSYALTLNSSIGAVFMGGTAGLLWLIAVNLTFWFLLSETLQDKLDLRAKWDLTKRRWIAAVALIVWFAIVLGINAVLGTRLYSLLGALNVVVLVMLAKFVVASNDERADWSEMKEQELAAKMYAEAYEKGLIDEAGNLTPLGVQKMTKKNKRNRNKNSDDTEYDQYDEDTEYDESNEGTVPEPPSHVNRPRKNIPPPPI